MFKRLLKWFFGEKADRMVSVWKDYKAFKEFYKECKKVADYVMERTAIRPR
jgi:hypothetical protein